jgi:hypothetical protein
MLISRGKGIVESAGGEREEYTEWNLEHQLAKHNRTWPRLKTGGDTSKSDCSTTDNFAAASPLESFGIHLSPH